MALSSTSILLLAAVIIALLPTCTHAFGAGNIASISAVEGQNWRHGDIEDILKQVACIHGHKWTSMMIKRVYFGNWLRDYSQAMDTGALKKAQPETIRILVWLLSFLSFGYATAEFEVTSDRLGVYRPEEHIDNPKDYNDNEDATKYDKRLRGLVRPVELEIDPETGMKNYIANGKGDWATSAAFVKYSFEQSIHHGRLYCHGHGIFKGNDEHLAEALRLLGQGLHCLEDFGAHTNYVELSLREAGFNNVFPHCGTNTQINLHGKHVFPLVTGTFGMVDFYHSVLGEATDHFTQSEISEMDNAMQIAESSAQSSSPLTTLIKLLSKVPGTRDLCMEAQQLQRATDVQARKIGSAGGNRGVNDWSGQPQYGGNDGSRDYGSGPGSQPDYSAPEAVFPHQPSGYDPNAWNQALPDTNQNQAPAYGAQWNDTYQHQSFSPQGGPLQAQWQPNVDPQTQHLPDITPQPTPSQPQLEKPGDRPLGLPGLPDFDAAKTIQQIYPILAFRDKVVRSISAVIEKIPGLEALVDRITETLTVFVLSLLAPFVRPVLKAMTQSLQVGSSGVVESSAQHQFEPWTDPNCTNPTHSMLSKDHFSNVLNQPAGAVAAEILKFIAPRVLYAWQHPDVPVDQVKSDVDKIFHHPAIRDRNNEVHRKMFEAVEKWVRERRGGADLNDILSSEGVKSGRNQKAGQDHTGHSHAPAPHFNTGLPNMSGGFGGFQQSHHSNPSGFNIGGFDVGNVLSSFGGSHGGGHGGSHGGQTNIGDYLNMASKLPIPGIQNLNKINKYSNFLGGFGGGRREIDPNEVGSAGGYSDQYGGTRDIGDSQAGTGMPNLGGEIGGAKELHEAIAARDDQGQDQGQEIAPPSGYEMYGQGDRSDSQGGGSGGGGYGQYQQQQQQQPWQGQRDQGYYRG